MAISMKAARINRNMTQAEAAEALGIHAQTLARYEKGLSSPTYEICVKICELYSVEWGQIFFS